MKTMEIVGAFFDGFINGGYVSIEECVREDKAVREHLSERQIDKMIEDSFPASDPPSSY